MFKKCTLSLVDSRFFSVIIIAISVRESVMLSIISKPRFLAGYCISSYAMFLLVSYGLFAPALPEAWFLLVSFGAPLLWMSYPRIGFPIFALSHFSWICVTVLPIVLRRLFESDFSMQLTFRHLIFFGFFGVINLAGMIWLIFLSSRRRV
jgi:hypothetical protein